MNLNRVRLLQEGKTIKGPVVYWMSRDQRAADNWALNFSLEKAAEMNTPLFVAFSLLDEYLDANAAQFLFMLRGLLEVKNLLCNLNIPFAILPGDPVKTIPELIKTIAAGIIVCDFDPLKIKRIWKRDIAKKINIPFYEVDAHNIVPCLFVSQKEEWAAYTIRPKIHRFLPEFLEEFPALTAQSPTSLSSYPDSEIEDLIKRYETEQIAESWQVPGETAAAELLYKFLKNITDYNNNRNNPNLNSQSNLSAYLHFGQISAQRIALEVRKQLGPNEDTEAFLEELIIRRELSDNYCYYNRNYDNFNGLQTWARESLTKHKVDKRDYEYTFNDFEHGLTHDPLWNAAQWEMVHTGKMHGFMRMYWAKKILEWTETPERALETAIILNNKYQLDGRDPNAYTGCAWAIGGIHDRAWTERPVFGKIRYMNYNGCKRKFNIDEYISKYSIAK